MDKIPRYAVDACSFITLMRIYPPDVFIGAWDAINEMADTGILISSHEIYLELEVQEDGVFAWARDHKQIFLPLEPTIQAKASMILQEYPKILDLRQLKSSADPFLIATAMDKSCIVVTEEIPTGPESKIEKIPNVCRSLNIKCINLLEMLRSEGVRLEIIKG